jgi:hypothetical protein
MSAVTWADIKAEYAAVTIGPLILAEARRAMESASRRYDPTVYARTANWADAIDDVVQQLVVDLLIGDGQLEYMMSVVRGVEDFRALMALQVKRLLARTRTRTVVDNLIDRARVILRSDEFQRHPGGRDRETYALPGAEPRGPTEDELWGAARTAALVPRVGIGRSDRAPLVYADEHLKALLSGVAADLGCRFSLRDVDNILSLVLTDFLPSFLDSDEGVSEVRSAALTAEEDVMVTQTAGSILKCLDGEQRSLLRDKLASIPDAEMAKARGISRPTLAARKHTVFSVLEAELSDLERPIQVAVMDRLGLALAQGEVTT